MSISSAPAATASRTSASLVASDARPDGNAVATLATCTCEPRSASTATLDEVGVHAHGGHRRRRGVARIGPHGLGAERAHLAGRVGALERRQVDHANGGLERPGLARGLDAARRERRPRALRRRPGRRPGRPCRKRRSDVSSRVASPSIPTSPPKALLRVALTASVYGDPAITRTGGARIARIRVS